MVYFMENPNRKWMMTGGTPILGNPTVATHENDGAVGNLEVAEDASPITSWKHCSTFFGVATH
jgi:hypothetical protein